MLGKRSSICKGSGGGVQNLKWGEQGKEWQKSGQGGYTGAKFSYIPCQELRILI